MLTGLKTAVGMEGAVGDCSFPISLEALVPLGFLKALQWLSLVTTKSAQPGDIPCQEGCPVLMKVASLHVLSLASVMPTSGTGGSER